MMARGAQGGVIRVTSTSTWWANLLFLQVVKEESVSSTSFYSYQINTHSAFKLIDRLLCLFHPWFQNIAVSFINCRFFKKALCQARKLFGEIHLLYLSTLSSAPFKRVDNDNQTLAYLNSIMSHNFITGFKKNLSLDYIYGWISSTATPKWTKILNIFVFWINIRTMCKI